MHLNLHCGAGANGFAVRKVLRAQEGNRVAEGAQLVPQGTIVSVSQGVHKLAHGPLHPGTLQFELVVAASRDGNTMSTVSASRGGS